jgi:hypothetical protein
MGEPGTIIYVPDDESQIEDVKHVTLAPIVTGSGEDLDAGGYLTLTLASFSNEAVLLCCAVALLLLLTLLTYVAWRRYGPVIRRLHREPSPELKKMLLSPSKRMLNSAGKAPKNIGKIDKKKRS